MVAAAEPDTSITVRARALSEAERSTPSAFVNVIDATPYANEVETVADALGDSVGVSVRRFGGLGAYSTLSVRGSSANQVQIYFDGVPVARAQNETVNLADLPLDSLDHIEVYRGVAPVRFGLAGIGGVVNLVPRRAVEAPATTLSASYGSFETRKIVAAHSRRIGRADVLGYVTYLGSRGNFRFLSNNDTPFNPFDDRRVERRNNAFDAVNTLLKAGVDLTPELRLDWTSESLWKQAGLPGRGANQSATAGAEDLRVLQNLRLLAPGWIHSRVDLETGLFGLWQQTGFQDRLGELGAGPQDRRDGNLSVGGNLQATAVLGAWQTLSGRFEAAGEWFDPSQRLTGTFSAPEATRSRITLAVQDDVSLWSGRIHVVPTLRYERFHDATGGEYLSFGRREPALDISRDMLSPGVGVQVDPVSWLSLRGNLGRYRRAPNFLELFGNTGAVIGNPGLVTETAWNRDAGFVVRLPDGAFWRDLRAEYAYFHNDVEDLILFVQRSAAIFRPENIGQARLRGHESGVRVLVADRLRLDANYTWQDAENRSRLNGGIYLGRQLPGRPRQELYLRAALSAGPGTLYYEFNFVGGNFLDQVNFDAVPSRDIHTLGATWRIAGPWALHFQARNLTDNQINDVAGFPLPGRAFFGSVAFDTGLPASP